MKNIRVFLSENFQFLEVKFSIHLYRRVFVMRRPWSYCVDAQTQLGYSFSHITLWPFIPLRICVASE